MRIRSLTCFVNVDETLGAGVLERAGDLVRAARVEIPRAGHALQTARLAVQPLDRILNRLDPVSFATAFEARYLRLGLDYGALLARTGEQAAHIPAMLRATDSLFASLRIASRERSVDLNAIRAAARVIYEVADTTPDGFGNFRFAAAANCPPGVPFFPTAYAEEVAPSFAFACETAELAVQSFSEAANLDDARSRLVAALNENGARLRELGERLEAQFGFHFAGMDFSMAPYPEEGRSLGTALERLTGVPFGARGTLFAVAFVTDCLRRADFLRAGFSGLMLPVLEDWTVALRSQEIPFTLDSLLLYSTVCGTGLDTVPLAGDTSQDGIAALLLDLAVLAVKLDKPLTARLIPVPGLSAGESTRFSFEYFSNARAFGVAAPGRLKVFQGSDQISFL